MTDKEIVLEELASSDPFEIAGAMVTIGKKYMKEFRPIVINYLDHEFPALRIEAIAALTFYWGEKEFEPIIHDWIKSDPDEENRELALCYWVSYHEGSDKPEVLREIASYVVDKSLPITFRAVAVRDFFRTKYGRNWHEQIPMSTTDALYVAQSENEFEALVPWEVIKPYC